MKLSDTAAGVMAVLLMYIPLLVTSFTGWALYIYWVLVAASYTTYAVIRLRRGEVG